MSIPSAGLMRSLRNVELPTLGHFIEEGFCDSGLKPVGTTGQMVGTARTLDLTQPDAIAVNRALLELRAGEVLVIRVEGKAHAPVGAVTAAAAQSRGAAGIVVDGPVTDKEALASIARQLPVFSRGFSARTTKRTGTLSRTAHDCDLTVGGVRIRPGDLVLGDAHGILVLPPDGPDPDILRRALASDQAEPELLSRIRSGEPLHTLLSTTL